MNKEIESIIRKSIRITGAACFAMGAAAVIASGAALKAMAEGTKYLIDTVEKILDEEIAAEAAPEEPVAEVSAEEEVPAEEVPAEEPTAEG